MTSAEARRHDLYNGLVDILGTERADTLMTHLPAAENTELATKADFRRLEARFDTLEARIDALGARIDRVVFAIVAALVVIIAQGFF